jgi:hypothetical protein
VIAALELPCFMQRKGESKVFGEFKFAIMVAHALYVAGGGVVSPCANDFPQ